MPQRFELKYKDADGSFGRPVMIHRAIFGSFERFMAILIEHTKGKWPFWLSPRQIMILPVDHVQDADYAQAVAKTISSQGSAQLNEEPQRDITQRCSVEIDASFNSLGKRLRAAQQAPYNVICVVGEKERAEGLVAIRSNDGTVQKQVPLETLVKACSTALDSRDKEPFPQGLV